MVRSYAVAGLVVAYAVVGCVLAIAVLPVLIAALVHAGWRPSALTPLAGALGPLAGPVMLSWSNLPDWLVALAAGVLLGRACPEWRWTTASACALGLLAGNAAMTWWCGLDLAQHYSLLLPWELVEAGAVLAGAALASGTRPRVAPGEAS